MYVRSATKTTAGYGGRPETHRHTEGAIQTCTSGHQLKLLLATEDDLRHTDRHTEGAIQTCTSGHQLKLLLATEDDLRHTEGAIQTCTSGQQLKLLLATEDDLRQRDTLREPSKHVRQVSN